MELYESISRENLRVLMTLFYEKAVEDDVLAPFFVDQLGDDLNDEEWIEHIELLADFWLAKIVGENTYRGNFIGAHAKIPHMKAEAFERWLEIFSVIADQVYVPEVAELFKKKGVQFSQQFIHTKLKI